VTRLGYGKVFCGGRGGGSKWGGGVRGAEGGW